MSQLQALGVEPATARHAAQASCAPVPAPHQRPPSPLPNPLLIQAVAATRAAVLDSNADLGIMLDTDVDRSGVVDRNGNGGCGPSCVAGGLEGLPGGCRVEGLLCHGCMPRPGMAPTLHAHVALVLCLMRLCRHQPQPLHRVDKRHHATSMTCLQHFSCSTSAPPHRRHQPQPLHRADERHHAAGEPWGDDCDRLVHQQRAGRLHPGPGRQALQVRRAGAKAVQ